MQEDKTTRCLPDNMEAPDSPIDLTELIDQIKVVAKARKDKDYSAEAVRELMVVWESRNKEILDAAETHRARLSEAEGLLRTLTIGAFEATGNKHPAPGVSIREVTKLGYDLAEALSWATEHKIALALDKKVFEGIVKQSPLDFVTSSIEIQATIATELEVNALE